MKFETDELIALYLMEHPEDEAGLGVMTIDGVDEQCLSAEVLVRFARWGVNSGHFDTQKVQEFVAWVEHRHEGGTEA